MDKHNVIHQVLSGKSAHATFGNLTVFEVSPQEIVKECVSLHRHHGLPIKLITAFDEREVSGFFKILYLFGVPGENAYVAPYILVKDEFPSLTPSIHVASVYERKIKSFFGLNPVGHPNPRTLILHEENWPENVFPLRKDFDWKTRPAIANGKYEFQKMGGEGIYEIPVGPVHAGIIEPGHFRFSVAGEEIQLLEARLGYSHKGSEKLFEVLPMQDKLKLSERISGDSSFSHSLAFCQAVESLGGIEVPERAKVLRVVFAELERVANHLGDIGAIMIDTGFNFGGANGARLREGIMRIHGRLAGSRFLRGVNAIGGVTKDISQEAAVGLIAELGAIAKDFDEVIEIAENSSTLANRLRETGKLDPQVAKDHGVTGVPWKALGFERDARVDFPYAAYGRFELKVATEKTGDVNARFHVRIKEVHSSMGILKKALETLPAGKIHAQGTVTLAKDAMAVGQVEGWRGDIVYVVATDGEGEISRVDVRDPSLLNWTALGYAGPGNIVPDFPLINKSFNLSYTGNDV